MKESPTSLWGLYLVDRFDNRTLIAEQEETAYLEPVLLEARKQPMVIPNRIDLSKKTATVFLQDIYHGDGLKGIPKGTVKKLRIGSYDFSPLKKMVLSCLQYRPIRQYSFNRWMKKGKLYS